jgi:hypothetical protein
MCVSLVEIGHFLICNHPSTRSEMKPVILNFLRLSLSGVRLGPLGLCYQLQMAGGDRHAAVTVPSSGAMMISRGKPKQLGENLL